MSNSLDSITYEFEACPELGEAIEIMPGLKWIRLPLPFLLGHINVWLLRDGDSWVIVDTGIYSKDTRDAWRNIFENELDDLPVSRVLVTHMHPDHVGCAGWLCEYFDIELSMTMEEYLLCRMLIADSNLPVPQEATRFFHAAGFTETQMALYDNMVSSFGKVVHSLPHSFCRLHHEREVEINGSVWQVITGHGHSPEHACLYNRDMNVLISGDQILPTISPNVSVYPTEPAANPLRGWFESLRRMKKRLPDDALVLPAHGRPFRGVMSRLDALIDEHETGLVKLHQACSEPRRAVDVFPALFKGSVSDNNRIMATGEAIAHLNYLVDKGEISVGKSADSTLWYCSR